jgi:hypothetical protein
MLQQIFTFLTLSLPGLFLIFIPYSLLGNENFYRFKSSLMSFKLS